MGVFSPGERETFERIASALERIGDGLNDLNDPKKSRDSLASIAVSLKKIANPGYVVSSWAEQNPHQICGECGALLEGASYDHNPTCSQFPVKPPK